MTLENNQLNLSPLPNNKGDEEEKQSIFSGSKGVVIAIIIGLVALAIGISAVIGFKSANQYQGFIKKIEDQTQELKSQNTEIAP